MPRSTVQGDLSSLIRNDEGLYEGNLIYYFQILFNHSRNLQQPYHNFRHMTHVLWLCYSACGFYRTQFSGREMRDLLIAAMFHDFDHGGMLGNDDLNIERAIRGFKKHAARHDLHRVEHIAALIRVTEFPHQKPSDELTLLEQIIRDADLGQTFSPVWIQQVVFGLAAEWGKTPLEVLQRQENFLRSIEFATEWGREKFPKAQIEEKIQEARELLSLLELESL